MLNVCAIDGISKHCLVKDASLVANIEDLTDDGASELGVALDSDEFLW